MSMIKGLFGVKSGSPVTREGRLYVVDGARLFDEKTGRRLGTQDQVRLLSSLARTAKAEKLEMHVVLESEKPLREVDAQGTFNGVKVAFVKDSEELIETALKLCRKAKGAVLVTSGPNLESRAKELQLTILTSSTFRKAYLAGGLNGGNGGGNGGNGGRDRRGGDRNRRGGEGRHDGRRGGRDHRRGNGGGGARPASASAPAAGGSGDAAAPAAAVPAGEGGAAPAPAAPAASPAVNALLDTVE